MATQDAVAPTSSLAVRKGFERMVTPKFKVGDFAVTLTFPEYFGPDHLPRKKDVRNFLRRVNYGLLGSSRFKRGERLKCAYVYELNACGTTIHLHMILENPANSRVSEETKLDFVLDSWISMRVSGARSANEVKYIDYVPGWVEYMFMLVGRHNAEMADVENWNL